MTMKMLQWREADQSRFKSIHWVTTRAVDNRQLVTLTGVVVTDRKGQESGEWRREDIVLGLTLPARFVPSGRTLQVEHWAPFVP